MIKLENHHFILISKTNNSGKNRQLSLKLRKWLMDVICTDNHYFCFFSGSMYSSNAFPCLFEVRHRHMTCFSQ